MSTAPEFPGLRLLKVDEAIQAGDLTVYKNLPSAAPMPVKFSVGLPVEERDLNHYYRPIPATPAPVSPAPAPDCNRCGDTGSIGHSQGFDGEAYEIDCPECHPDAPEVGTGSETSPDAGASIREALRKLDQACQDLGRAALPVWDYNPPEYLRKEWEALADVLAEIGSLSVAKPAEQREAEQIPTPHPVAEAEQSPLPAGDGQAARLVSLMVDYLETDKIMSIPVPETSLGWLAAAKTWLAQDPTRTPGKGE